MLDGRGRKTADIGQVQDDNARPMQLAQGRLSLIGELQRVG